MPATPTIDLLSPESFASGQPHEMYRWLRDNDPVHWHDEPGGKGFWAVTRYAEVKVVGRDAATFSSKPTIGISDDGLLALGDHEMMLMTDPPKHTRYRRLLVDRFTPRAVRSLQLRISELSEQIIDAVIERGECDFVTDIAGELPSYVVAELLGLPLDDGRRLYELTETIHSAPSALPEGAQAAAVGEMFGYAPALYQAKRADPGDDIASRLVMAEIDGVRLDEIDFALFFILLVDAGGDTTRNLVSGGMLALCEHPDQRVALLTDVDGRMDTAVEEMLRWVSPVVYMRRTATQDVELAGRSIKQDDKVVMYYGSANRDDAVFDQPDRFDIGRSSNEHVAFGGGGPHFCLGAHLARMEIKALFGQILRRMPDLELAGSVEWLPSNFISGPKHLPVSFRPGGR